MNIICIVLYLFSICCVLGGGTLHDWVWVPIYLCVVHAECVCGPRLVLILANSVWTAPIYQINTRLYVCVPACAVVVMTIILCSLQW